MSSATYDPEKFRSNANDYLSNYYNDHKSRCVALALSNPTKFYNAKGKVVEILKRDLVDKFYDSIFDVLSKGTVNGKQIYGGILDLQTYPIRYPAHLINEEALSFSSTIDHMLSHIVDIIMPESIDIVVTSKLSSAGKESLHKGGITPPIEG